MGDDRKIQKKKKRAIRERRSKRRRGRIGGEMITKGTCKGEDGQIMRTEKNEEWEEDDRDSFMRRYSRLKRSNHSYSRSIPLYAPSNPVQPSKKLTKKNYNTHIYIQHLPGEVRGSALLSLWRFPSFQQERTLVSKK